MRDEDLAAISAELAALREGHRLRQRPVIDSPSGRVIVRRGPQGRERLLNWGSNDYLGLVRDLRLRNSAAKALRQFGSGAAGARLLAGGLQPHRALEQRLARFLAVDEVLLTTTGYQANLALWSAIAGPEDCVILDRLAHASAYDGVRLAGATLRRSAHNDPADLERLIAAATAKGARRVLVGVESIYSMDGDAAPLVAIAEICAATGAWLVVDEAHAFGVFGTQGRGLCQELGVRPDLLVATCSKALGSQGGFIAGAAPLIEWIVNRGRSFIFSTAPVPAAVAAADRALRLLGEDDGGWQARLLTVAQQLREDLTAQGWAVVPGPSPIIPVVVGDEAGALALAEDLRRAGHYVPAVRPPTVPPGGCRLRITVTAAHRPADLRRLVRDLAQLSGDAG